MSIETRELYADEHSGVSVQWMRVPAGANSAPHRHSCDEWVFVLQGAFIDGERPLAAGSWSFRPAGEEHSAATESGCELLLIYMGDATLAAPMVDTQQPLTGSLRPADD